MRWVEVIIDILKRLGNKRAGELEEN